MKKLLKPRKALRTTMGHKCLYRTVSSNMISSHKLSPYLYPTSTAEYLLPMFTPVPHLTGLYCLGSNQVQVSRQPALTCSASTQLRWPCVYNAWKWKARSANSLRCIVDHITEWVIELNLAITLFLQFFQGNARIAYIQHHNYTILKNTNDAVTKMLFCF
jgi:hypothetical protein